MRVLLMTNGLRFGGAERIVEALAIGLARSGDDVHVAATTRGGPVQKNLELHGIDTTVLGLSSPFDARFVARLVRLVARLRPEIIHSHLAVSDIATQIVSPLFPRIATVTTVHNNGVELSSMRRRLWHRALSRFDRVLGVSDHVLMALPAGLPARVVRPSLVSMDPPMDRKTARERLGVGMDVPLVMALGRLVEVKGFDVLQEAQKSLKSTGARMIVVGEGPMAVQLAQSALELVGARDDAGEIVAAADVVVCPSRSEGFPQVPIQAMAAGVPVVASRVGGMLEVVEHEQTGLLVPPDDPVALARAIDALLEDPMRARTLGQQGRALLLRRGLTKEAMIEKTRAVYGEVA